MRSFAFVVVFSCMINAAFSQKILPADLLVKAAMQKAGVEKKNLFIISTATWCRPCQALKQILHDEVIQPMLEKKYEFIYLYATERGNKMKNNNPGTLDLLVKYEGNLNAVPYWFIIDTTGKKLADSYNKQGCKEYISYPDSEKLLKDFINILKNSSDFTANELEIIKKRLEDLIEF